MMTAVFAIQTIAEIIVALLLVWGFLNEKKLVAFERKFAHAVVINVHNHKHRKLAEKKRAERAAQPPANNMVLLQAPLVLADCPQKLDDCSNW